MRATSVDDQPATAITPKSYEEQQMTGNDDIISPGITNRWPVRRADIFQEPEIYATLRSEAPIVRATFPSGKEGWILTRYDDVRAIGRDKRVSSNQANPGFPHAYQGHSTTLATGSLMGMDAPTHTEQRRMILSFFSDARVQSYRTQIEEFVDRLIEEVRVLPQPVDLVEAYALRVPTWLSGLIFGVPASMYDVIIDRTAVRVSYTASPKKMQQATDDLQAVIAELIAMKRAEPQDDLFSFIVQQHDAGLLSHKDTTDMMQLLIVGGHESTANAIALSILALLENPDQLEALRADRSLLKNAIEELLRYATTNQTIFGRVATDDIELHGQTIKKGEGIRALILSANRDESMFPNAGRLDIRRDAKRHLAFGFGPHVCIGQGYARLELEVALWAAITRLPNLRLAVPHDELAVRWDAGVHGLDSLPALWDMADAC
jgi:cytochrome P450